MPSSVDLQVLVLIYAGAARCHSLQVDKLDPLAIPVDLLESVQGDFLRSLSSVAPWAC